MLDLKDLKCLIEVIDEGGFEAAAKKLCISAGAVSQRIRRMETQVGKPLVIRRNPPYLTAAGERVMSFARRIWSMQMEMDQSILGDVPRNSKIAIAVNQDSLTCWFLKVIESFTEATGMFVEVITADSEMTEELFQKGRVLAAVTSNPKAIPGCKSKPLGAAEYEIVCSRDFALKYFPNGLSAEALKHAPGLYFDRQDLVAAGLLKKFDVDISETNRHFIPGSAEINRAAELGLGWCANSILISRSNGDDSPLIKLCPDTYTVNLYWKTWDLATSEIQSLSGHVYKISRACLSKSE